ncbi:hypothetical protein NDU88_000307 [Pleurodeles waltl]|uniref:Uncharacterized protein n=1 Tax=Pleurodeles waltl TaxID=8319 RepID=A0AAV7Q5B9_PLEWA|nr:hypothetical protein NDU88_000307 [Pleurodeles waltl]
MLPVPASDRDNQGRECFEHALRHERQLHRPHSPRAGSMAQGWECIEQAFIMGSNSTDPSQCMPEPWHRGGSASTIPASREATSQTPVSVCRSHGTGAGVHRACLRHEQRLHRPPVTTGQSRFTRTGVRRAHLRYEQRLHRPQSVRAGAVAQGQVCIEYACLMSSNCIHLS